MSTAIFLARSLQSIVNVSASAAVTASGPSQPPEADNASKFSHIALMSDENANFWVTYE
jgi:hypothetical protein